MKEIAEVINRNSLEAHFNDTPDYILAKVAVEAMENFAEASARRDNWHGFKEADKPGEVVRNEDCDNCPVRGICPEHKKPEAFDVPKEVRAMAEFFGKMFPGSKVEIPRASAYSKPSPVPIWVRFLTVTTFMEDMIASRIVVKPR